MATTIAVESVLGQFNALTTGEQLELRKLINGHSTNGEATTPTLKLDPKDEASMHWMIANEHLYAGRWIALDGDRLIAHNAEHSEVIKAVKADGAELPIIYFVEPEPESPFLRV